MNQTRSKKAWEVAQQHLPGGVNSPVRAFGSVGGTPPFVARGEGSKIEDIDGNAYIDYVCSWGPLILGHAHPEVIRAVQEAASQGTSFGAPTENESLLAEKIIAAVPSIERVRLVNSGTEATMTAIRLARGFTGRDKIVKIEGCYHGHVGHLLVKAGSGATTLGIPDSAGVPADFTRHTLSVPFNDVDAVKKVFREFAEEIACVILEPIPGNMGVVLPEDGYLQELRLLTQEHGTVLIFDEVISGFRVAYGGAQELFGVTPDLTCLGKVIGGGLPVGAYGGKREIMEHIAPLGPVYQAGTLSGNPLAVSAGLATLDQLAKPGVYDQLESLANKLADGLEGALAEVPTYHTRVGSMLCTFFTDSAVHDYQTAKQSDTARYAQYFHHMLERGVWLAPSQFETMFVSLAHSEEDIERTIAAAAGFRV